MKALRARSSERARSWCTVALFFVACGGTSLREGSSDDASGGNGGGKGGAKAQPVSGSSSGVGGNSVAGQSSAGTGGVYGTGGTIGDGVYYCGKLLMPEYGVCITDAECNACFSYTAPESCLSNEKFAALNDRVCAEGSPCFMCRTEGVGGEGSGGAPSN